MVLLVAYRVVMIVAIVVQSDAVKLLERIRNFAHGSCKTRVQGNTFYFRRANVNTLTLLDISEVWRLDPMALMRDDGGLRVAQERPLGGAEERCSLNVRSASTGSESSSLVLDEQFANQRLAEAVDC